MNELAAAVRFLHVAACVLLAGSYVFLAAVLPQAPGAATMRAAAHAWHLRMRLWALGLVILSGAAGAWILAAMLEATLPEQPAGVLDAQSVFTLLTQTLSGQVTLLRAGLAVVLLALILRRRPAGGPHATLNAQTVFSLLLLATLALSGHAAANEGLTFLIEAGTAAAHIVAAGAWLGALVPLAVALRAYFAQPEPSAARAVRAATAAFSKLGIACVLTLLLTGVVNTAIHVGSIPQLVGTPYGERLLLKIALLFPLLAIAAYNLVRINPAIAAAWPAAEAALPQRARTLARNALLEAVIGAAVLLTAASLASTPPARHMPPDWPFAFRWDWTALENPRAQNTFQIGLTWMIAGLLVMQLVWLTTRWRLIVVAAGLALGGYGVSAMLQPLYTDAYPTTYWRPEVPYNAISIASGSTLYAQHCAGCHGVQGRGDGPAGERLDPKPADLTARHTNTHTAGDLFWWLTHGKHGSAMPAFGNAIAADERWDLINFVRALGSGRRARGLAPVIDDKREIVAPDFSYATAASTSTLKDHRGERLVLLVLASGRNLQSRLRELASARSAFEAVNIDVLVIPAKPGDAAAAPGTWLVTEGNQEIHATYGLLAAGFGEGAGSSMHAEFLVDRQGYIRARWLPADNDAWRDPAAIVKQAEALLRERRNLPPPDDHVH